MAANYILLERIELNASAASVTFSNIPQSGYTDLKIVVSARSSTGIYQTDCNIQVGNGSVDTGSNYQTKELYGDGTSVGSGSFTTTNIHPPIAGAGATSNTFGNFEIYIPNYTSSSQKSISCDVVTENNATNAAARLAAYLWTGTSAINIITLTAAGTSFVQYSTFSLYGLAAVGTTPAIAPKASGGNITTDGTYWYHTFLASGTFTPATNLTCDVLQIAGGGSGSAGGNSGGAGGGGAGGLLYFTSQSVTTSQTVTVGAGGAAVATTGGAAINGNTGSNSQFGSLTASAGGGYGGGGLLDGVGGNGGPGGSGGGAGRWSNSTTQTGGSATPSGQGFKGGDAISTGAGGRNGAGGGGAGAAGANGTNVDSGGGAGLNTYSSWATATSTGVSGYYAGGGAGSSITGSASNGGAGGGGNGVVATGSTQTGNSGTVNTGSGGAGMGGGDAAVLKTSGSGGSGIVIVRYSAA